MSVLTWARRASPFDGLTRPQALIQAGARLIAGGTGGSGAIMVSDDGGATWATRTTPLDDTGVYGLAYSPDLTRVVAVGFDGTATNMIIYSDDFGDTWTGAGNPCGGVMISVARDDGGGLFVAGSTNGTKQIATSPDGITWTARTTPWDGSGAAGGTVNGVCFAAGAINKWFAVGVSLDGSKTAMSAPDPTSTWTELATGPFDGQTSAYYGFGTGQAVAYDDVDALLVATSYSGTTAIATSADGGATWTGAASDLDGAPGYGIAFTAGRILVVGELAIVESVDAAATWQTDTSEPFSDAGGTPPSGYGCFCVLLLDAATALAGGSDSGFTLALAAAPASFPARRTFEGREWKWIVCDLKTTTTITVLTSFATEISCSRLLHEPWPAQLTVPSDDPRVNTIFEGDGLAEPSVAEGVRVLIGFRDTGARPRWEVAWTGLVLQVEDTVDNAIPATVVSAWDVRQYMRYLPVVNPAGDIPGENGLSFTATKANVIARQLLDNLAISAWGGLLGVLLDTTTGDDEDCAELDIDFQRGMSLADAWTALEQTGAIDIVLLPVYDPQSHAGTISQVNFHAQAGAERDVAIFAWGHTPRTLDTIDRVENGNMRGNVVAFYDANGKPAPVQTDTGSVDKYGPYVIVQAFPGLAAPGSVQALAVERLLLSATGQTIVTSSPAAPRAAQAVQDYDLGDRVPLYVDRGLRKPLAALTRIYGIPFMIGDDSFETIDQLRTDDTALA